MFNQDCFFATLTTVLVLIEQKTPLFYLTLRSILLTSRKQHAKNKWSIYKLKIAQQETSCSQRVLSGCSCFCFVFLGNLHFAYVTMDDMKSSSVRYACYLKNSVLDIRYPGSYTQLKVTRGLQHKLLLLSYLSVKVILAFVLDGTGSGLESESASKVGLWLEDWTRNKAQASSIRCNKMQLFVTCDYRLWPIVHLLLNLGWNGIIKALNFSSEFIFVHLVLHKSWSRSRSPKFLNPRVGVLMPCFELI